MRTFLENKESKQGDRYSTAIFLEKRLGKLESSSKSANSSSNASASNDGPLCAGIYNSTTGIKVIIRRMTDLGIF